MKYFSFKFFFFIFFVAFSCKITQKNTEESIVEETKPKEIIIADTLSSDRLLPNHKSRKIALKEDIYTINETIREAFEVIKITRQRINRKLKLDTNHLAKSLLPILDNTEKEIIEIKQKIANSNPVYLNDLIKYSKLLVEYSKQIDNLNANLDNTFDKAWQIDAIFGRSKYKISNLSEDEEKSLLNFVENIKIFYNEEFKKNPNKKWKIKIQTIGYTDTTGFIKPHKKNKLIKELIKGMEDEMPQESRAKRLFLNKRLSLFRANSMNEFFKKKLSKLNAIIESENIGMGENVPSNKITNKNKFDNMDKDAWKRIAVSNFYVIFYL